MPDDETEYGPDGEASGGAAGGEFPGELPDGDAETPKEPTSGLEAPTRVMTESEFTDAGAPAAADALSATRVIEGEDGAGASPAAEGAPGGAETGPGGTRVLPPEERGEVAPAPSTGGASTFYGEARSAGATARHQLAPGTVLFGEYEIVDVLGAGGMGEVYRARHRRLDETRAIKVMHANVARDPTAGEFFDREAKALLSVRHDAVVNCHDLLSDDEGRVYLVMEMVDGISLADRLRKGGALAEEEVRTLARRVGAGLAAAHRRGVIHRDLSPDNIILPGGRPEEAKLIDFGIAKVLEAGQETILEGFKGKLAYASPEQLGFFEGRIDGRSDIYSLGLVLYAAATGAALPMGSSLVEAVDARRQLAGVPDDCPPSLRSDIHRLLALHPDDRPDRLDGLFEARAAERPRPAPGRLVLPWAGAVAFAGLAAAALIALRPEPQLDAEPVSVQPVVSEEAVEPVEPVEVDEVAEAVEPPEAAPVAPAPVRRDRAADARTRLRVLGLLRGAQAALERGALMSPAGENAYAKYREVLSIDPGNREARRGIRVVADRYIALARGALERGELDEAAEYLAKARSIAPRHPELQAVSAALKDRRS